MVVVNTRILNNPEELLLRIKHNLKRILQFRWGLSAVIATFMLNGCVAEQAPAFSLLGSYFPSWMACASIGIVSAIIMRVVFIHIGIDELLPGRLFVYVCLALAVAFISSLLLFSR